MSGEVPAPRIEQLMEIAVSSKLLLIGREALRRSKSHLHFVLIATDIIPSHRDEVLADCKHYPVVQHFTATDFERLFKLKGAKSLFEKAGWSNIHASRRSMRRVMAR